MATLVHHWPLHEPITGLVDHRLDFDQRINSVYGYPQWVDGGGLKFGNNKETRILSGGVIANPPDYCRTTPWGNPSGCNFSYGNYALSIWLNSAGADTRRNELFVVGGSQEYWTPIDHIYLTSNGYPAFGGSFVAGSTWRGYAAIGTTDISRSVGWHHLLGVMKYNSSTRFAEMEIWLNAKLAGSYSITVLTREAGHGRFMIGAAHSREPYYVFPGSPTGGSCAGILRDARVYCGTITPREVEEIYLEGPTLARRRPPFPALFAPIWGRLRTSLIVPIGGVEGRGEVGTALARARSPTAHTNAFMISCNT